MWSPGTRIGQRYECLRELGTGGTAVVIEALDHVLDRRCAVKLLLETGGPGQEGRSLRLRQEAAALATLDHPRVVRVYDLGEHEGRPFLAMEFVPGGSLADRLLADGPMVPSQAVDRILEVLEALGAAHQAGIVHRDVKPHNVLLRDDGTAALADFGIARHETRSHTRTGVALGSIDYMAPEQRVDARRAGPPADVYGVGCTLFHLLSGETPVDLYLAPGHSPRWEAIPKPLRPALRRATAVDPSDRYGSAEAFAQDLRRVRPGLDGVAARRFTPMQTPAPVPTRAEGAEGVGAATAEGGKLAVVIPDAQPTVGAEEWAWANGRGPETGRTNVLVALATVGALLVVLVVGWPLLEDRLRARGASEGGPPEMFAIDALEGTWRGSFGAERHGGVLDLRVGDASDVSGELELDLDGNGLRTSLSGAYAPKTGALTLRGPGGSLACRLDPYGVCRGTLAWGNEQLDFALVHLGR